jgi:hypothetical protein
MIPPPMAVYDDTPVGEIRRAVASGTFVANGDPDKMAQAIIDCADRTPARSLRLNPRDSDAAARRGRAPEGYRHHSRRHMADRRRSGIGRNASAGGGAPRHGVSARILQAEGAQREIRDSRVGR